MATVSFDTLEALARRPVSSETAASKVAGYVRFTEVNGPFKTEWNIYQVGTGDNFTDNDTLVTGLVRPISASAEWANVDAGASQHVVSASLEGVETAAAYRTVTVRDAHDVAAAGLIVKVVGF
jgi:hypothetical protein